jgi:hypothetical protein
VRARVVLLSSWNIVNCRLHFGNMFRPKILSVESFYFTELFVSVRAKIRMFTFCFLQ